MSIPLPTHADVPYAAAEPPGTFGHLLDLYLPASADRPLPLVIWSSGSAFLRDDGKAGASAIADFFNHAGYAVAGVSVRSSSQALFPAQVHDLKAAIRWLRAHAAEHGIDPDRFAFMGNSSGGWVASMAALTSEAPELEGDVGERNASSRVQAAVDFYGPTDFLQMDAHMLGDCAEFRAYLGITGCHDDPRSPESLLVGGPIEERPDEVARANPVRYVSASAPPMLILHGQLDPFVPHHQSELLYEALRDRGCEATFYSIPNVGHEHPYVVDAARAHGGVAYRARGGEETVDEAAPPPTWETIERFIAGAFGLDG
jgi:acetyl esterase/lipase